MPVNEKKLLEKFITIEVALNTLSKVCQDAKKELSHVPQISAKKAEMKQLIDDLWLKKEKRQMRMAQKKLQNQ